MPNRKLSGAIAAALGALVFLALAWRHTVAPSLETAPRDTVCAACGHAAQRSLRSVPAACSSCGKHAVYPAMPCPRCQTPTPIGAPTGPQQRRGLLVCPKCHHVFAPAAPGSQPATDRGSTP